MIRDNINTGLASINSLVLPHFKAYHVPNAKTLWLHPDYYEKTDSTFTEFSNKFAYINVNSSCFVDIMVDPSNSTELEAEPYGGIGSGRNGGGVRCGNKNGYQIKGIGINMFLGDTNDFSHNNGIYSTHEALHDLINTNVLENIIPGGVVKIKGLIHLGYSSHTDPDFRIILPLAITIRDICIRPAHFMRCFDFKINPKIKHSIHNDIYRTRAVCKGLFEKSGGLRNLLSEIEKFARNLALQSAFCSIFRISHGAISPSNVSIDGKWLDVTNATMLPACYNYSSSNETIPFYREEEFSAVIIKEFCESLFKYNFLDLKTDYIIKTYFESLDKFKLIFIPGIFGICPNLLIDREVENECQTLLKFYKNFSRSDESIKVGDEKLCGLVDETSQWLVELYVKRKERFDRPEISSLITILRISYLYQNIFKNYNNYIKSCLIKAIRKPLFSKCFYLGRLKKNTFSYMDENGTTGISDYIDRYVNFSKFLFEKLDNNNGVCVWHSSKIIITFTRDGVYHISHGYTNNFYDNSDDIINYISMLDNEVFYINGYNGFNDLNILLRSVAKI